MGGVEPSSNQVHVANGKSPAMVVESRSHETVPLGGRVNRHWIRVRAQRSPTIDIEVHFGRRARRNCDCAERRVEHACRVCDGESNCVNADAECDFQIWSRARNYAIHEPPACRNQMVAIDVRIVQFAGHGRAFRNGHLDWIRITADLPIAFDAEMRHRG